MAGHRWHLPSFLVATLTYGCLLDEEHETSERVGSPKEFEIPAKPVDLYITDAVINAVSVKDGRPTVAGIEVPGTFDKVSGAFRFTDGATHQSLAGTMKIDLGSWDTGLQRRDEHIKTHFFHAAEEKEAVFILDSLDGLPLEGLEEGQEIKAMATGRLSLAGGSMGLKGKVKLSRDDEETFQLDTLEPFIVSIEKLGMTRRLLKLMKICNHESIDDMVKVAAQINLSTTRPAVPVTRAATTSPQPREQ